MGLFNLFKKPPKIQDDLFGEMTFIDVKGPSESYFESRVFFKPGAKMAEALIPGDINGPASGQKDFFTNLQNNFDLYIEKMKPVIENEFKNWKKDFVIKDFNREFFLDCITCPRLEKKPLKWEMSFTTIHDRNHWVHIEFSDDTPTGIMIDG